MSAARPFARVCIAGSSEPRYCPGCALEAPECDCCPWCGAAPGVECGCVDPAGEDRGSKCSSACGHCGACS